MAKRILLVLFVAFALGLGTAAWFALAAKPVPAHVSADESPDTGCNDPAPAMLIADIRWSGRV